MGVSTAIAMGRWLSAVTCGCACLVRATKPSSWPRVNSPSASITTSKVATSLPWWASSTTYSSAWSWQASFSSILAGASYSTCTASTFPWALKLMLGLATWLLGPPTQMPAITSIVAGSAGAYSGAESPVGSTSVRLNILDCNFILIRNQVLVKLFI